MTSTTSSVPRTPEAVAVEAMAGATLPADGRIDRDDRRRLWFGADAAVTSANGVGYLALATVLDGVLGAGAGLLRPIGAFLAGFGALVGLYALRRTASAVAGWALVAVNVVWVAASLGFALGAADLTAAGRGWAVLQALVVTSLAILQGRTLRRRG